MAHYTLEDIYPKPSRRRRAIFLHSDNIITLPKSGDTVDLGHETLTVRSVSGNWAGSTSALTRIEFQEWADDDE